MEASSELRRRLVETLHQAGVINQEAVAQAFFAIPRDVFLPGHPLNEVYRDVAIVIKEEGGAPVSSSSQPAIMAIMLEQLDVRRGMRVLEVGAGTGYNAALLRHLVGDEGNVVTIDIDSDVARSARERLDAVGFHDVDVICADGADGWPAKAPFDRIELTVGTADISPSWVEQLRPGGVLVLPLWVNSAQVSLALEKQDGILHSRSVEPCGFMRIRGKLAGFDRYVTIAPGTYVATDRPDLDPDQMLTLLNRLPKRERWSAGRCDDFAIHAALWDRDGLMVAFEDAKFGYAGTGFGLFDSGSPSLCVLLPTADGDGAEVLTYGTEHTRARMRNLFERWQAIGSPRVQDLAVSVYPQGSAPDPAGLDQVAIDTWWWRLIFSPWPDRSR